MKDSFLIFVVLNLIVIVAYGIFPDFYEEISLLPIDQDADVGEPLFLTPYIKDNRIQDAQQAAQVRHPVFKNIIHYSGFFTVDETMKSNMFMWFIPSENNTESDPVMLWVPGGPGLSAISGLSVEGGPFRMKNESEIILNSKSWTKHHHMLYIDTPVQSGFSFTKEGFAHDMGRVIKDLYEALRQFFLLFPKLRKNKFFISGGSYAGHVIPALATKIHQENAIVEENFKIILEGLSISSGWVDPINQLEYGDYLYQHGLINSNTRKTFNDHRDNISKLINEGKYGEASSRCYTIYAEFKNISKFQNVYNYLQPTSKYNNKFFDTFVQKPEIRKAIHVGNLDLHSTGETAFTLRTDVMKSYAHLLPELFRNYRVLIYNGQLDIICAHPLTMNYLDKLNFDAAEEYKNAARRTWFYNGEIAGLFQVAGNLTVLLVMNAGHAVVSDQPDFGFDLIYRFTRNLEFD